VQIVSSRQTKGQEVANIGSAGNQGSLVKLNLIFGLIIPNEKNIDCALVISDDSKCNVERLVAVQRTSGLSRV